MARGGLRNAGIMVQEIRHVRRDGLLYLFCGRGLLDWCTMTRGKKHVFLCMWYKHRRWVLLACGYPRYVSSTGTWRMGRYMMKIDERLETQYVALGFGIEAVPTVSRLRYIIRSVYVVM